MKTRKSERLSDLFSVIACILIIFSISFYSLVHAQVSAGGTPISFTSDLPKNIPSVTTPPIDAATLKAEDEREAAEGMPFRFGFGFDVEYSLDNSGTWEELADDGRLWRLRIESPRAYSINLIYGEFWLPPGAQFFIYSEDKKMVIGAFTEDNNKEHGQFATGLVKGPVSILEYYEPLSVRGTGAITISRIIHGYRNIFDKSTAEGVLGKILDFGDSDLCNNNVYCGEGLNWIDQIRAVGMLLTAGGTRFCSGALVNNVEEDMEPYFLTANHCDIGSSNTWIVMFNYEAEGCSNPASEPSTDLTTSGTTIRAKWSGTDFMLLELQETPPLYYQVYYPGWSRSTSAASSSVGVHHPSGDIKKISYENSTAISMTWGSPANNHWKVTFDDGVIEHGSSGSPLYDQNKRIVGQLHGNPNYNPFLGYCDQPDAWYGKFSLSWTGGGSSSTRLKDWLDPEDYDPTTLNGKLFGVSGTVAKSVKWKGTIILVGNVTVPSGKTLTILSNSTVNLNGWYIKSTGGNIVRQSGVIFTPKDISVKSGTTLKGQYLTIQSAINNASSSQDVYPAAGTYTENINMKSIVDVVGAGKYSTTINGTVTWQNKTGAKLKDLTVNNRITINSGNDNRIENVQAKKRIELNYGSNHEITDVTANHTDYYGIYALDTDPYIDNFVYNTRYPVGIYGLSGAYLDIYDGQLEDKSRGVLLNGYADARVSSIEFCGNGWDIYAYTGSSANAYGCVWSGDPNYRTYGDVTWIPQSYDICGFYKSVVAQQQPASAISVVSLENEDGWDTYSQALSGYNAIKELLRSDTLSGMENEPEKYVTEYKSVVNLFKQVVTEYPGSLLSIKALSRIADCYWNLRQPEMVFDYINVVVDNSTYDSLKPYALKELVPYYLSKNDNDQALKVIDKVLALLIDDQLTGEMLFSKGIIYRYYKNDLKNAVAVFQQVISLFPDSPLALAAQANLGDVGEGYAVGDSTSSALDGGELVMGSYPNPFNPAATIRFSLPEAGNVRLMVYDIMGREVIRLVDGSMDPGWQTIIWNGRTIDGREVPTGLYIARLVTPTATKTIKLVMMK